MRLNLKNYRIGLKASLSKSTVLSYIFVCSMVKYMSNSLQLYLPPDYLINRDFLKLVLAG